MVTKYKIEKVQEKVRRHGKRVVDHRTLHTPHIVQGRKDRANSGDVSRAIDERGRRLQIVAYNDMLDLRGKKSGMGGTADGDDACATPST